MIKLIVSGSRKVNRETTFMALNKFYLINDVGLIINGGCKNSPDCYSTEFAIENNIKWEEYPAEWNNIKTEKRKVKVNIHGELYNALAGFNRNEFMVNLCQKNDWVLAIWDENSPGTKHMIDYAQGKINLCIFYLEQNVIVLNHVL